LQKKNYDESREEELRRMVGLYKVNGGLEFSEDLTGIDGEGLGWGGRVKSVCQSPVRRVVPRSGEVRVKLSRGASEKRGIGHKEGQISFGVWVKHFSVIFGYWGANKILLANFYELKKRIQRHYNQSDE
jgi:hypothetical protein